MNENKRTLIYLGTAAVLAVLAFIAAPRQIVPEAFNDQGQAFFPDFADPNQATTLEIVSFDSTTGSATPFKVTFKDGRWTIPSHHDYPADAKDRLAKTAAGVIDIKKDDIRTENVADHELCGVVDPLDQQATSLSGRGARVTLKDANDAILADFIVGKAVEGMSGGRFVRVPGQKRVYAAKMSVDLSPRFEDWVDRDLLNVTKGQIAKVTFKDYSINERTLQVEQHDNFSVEKSGNSWRFAGGGSVDSTRIGELLTSLDELQIVGVRPKPEGLTASLQSGGDGVRLTQQDLMSLQSRGFYMTRDGQLLSNEGELQVQTDNGVHYTLRFGEVLYGSGALISAGDETARQDNARASENRYLFITADYVPSAVNAPTKPSDLSFQQKAESELTEKDKQNKEAWARYQEWEGRNVNGQELADQLDRRYASWYYVISAASFDKLRMTRTDLRSKS